jgi:hypothetical protein
MQTGHVRLLYGEREEAIAVLVRDEVEQRYRQILADFGMSDPGRPITFEFRPVSEAEPARYPEAHFQVPSPLLLGVRDDGQPDEELLATLTQSAALFLAMEKSGLYDRQPGPGSSWVVLRGIVAWEMEKWKPGAALPNLWQDWLEEAAAEDSLLPLTSLWPPFEFRTGRDVGLAFAQASSVVAYAVEQRGADAVAALLEALGRNLDAHEAIEGALGMDLATFETGWEGFVGRTVTPQ